jgi:hypothetical protein
MFWLMHCKIKPYLAWFCIIECVSCQIYQYILIYVCFKFSTFLFFWKTKILWIFGSVFLYELMKNKDYCLKVIKKNSWSQEIRWQSLKKLYPSVENDNRRKRARNVHSCAYNQFHQKEEETVRKLLNEWENKERKKNDKVSVL